MRRECGEGMAWLGSARQGGCTTSFVSVSSWLMVGLFLIRRAFDAYLSVLTVSSCNVSYRSLVCVVCTAGVVGWIDACLVRNSGGDACDHDSAGVAAERVLQEPGEL